MSFTARPPTNACAVEPIKGAATFALPLGATSQGQRVVNAVKILVEAINVDGRASGCFVKVARLIRPSLWQMCAVYRTGSTRERP